MAFKPLRGKFIRVSDGEIRWPDPAGGTDDLVLSRSGGTLALRRGERGSDLGAVDLVAAMLAKPVFYSAHRGEGAINAEHTLEGYTSAYAAGADAVEVSVRVTSDGRVVCMHDATTGRTCDLDLTVAATPWNALRVANVDIGASLCGPSTPAAKIPLLTDVLDRLAGRVPVFLEPKDASAGAIAKIFAVLDQYPGVGNWLIWKYYRGTDGAIASHALQARARYGARTWAYLDAADSNATINAACANNDMIGLPNAATTDAQWSMAVATGTPVVAFYTRRRVDRDRLILIGVRGFQSPHRTYLATDDAIATSDFWGVGVVSPGQIPYTEDTTSPPVMSATDADITLSPAEGATASVLLGDLCSTDTLTETTTYTLSMKWPVLPTPSTHSDFVFGHANDSAYKHQDAGNAPGMHLVVRPQVSAGDPTHCAIQVYTHVTGSSSGTKIGEDVTSAAIEADTWEQFTVELTSTTVTVTRVSTATVLAVATATYRGPYIHFTVGSADTVVHLKGASVT